MPEGSCNHHHAPPQGEPPVGITTAEHLAEHLAEFACPSMAVVCVGNEICGDDGDALQAAIKSRQWEVVRLLRDWSQDQGPPPG